ncbi:MAG TPA: response regulator [Calditrichia bacterium]|nr:response regulator [Calditrichota bacterium]HQU72069.1 response regulator [Calditrichia bacterium]HQV31231.1 response regulator [Calditrichia bacterium]
MPEMDGFHATRSIRGNPDALTAADTPIIALTANALEQDRQKCLDAGMDDYLPKPVKRKDLAQMLDRFLITRITE